jgi:hypothetical protein
MDKYSDVHLMEWVGELNGNLLCDGVTVSPTYDLIFGSLTTLQSIDHPQKPITHTLSVIGFCHPVMKSELLTSKCKVLTMLKKCGNLQ